LLTGSHANIEKFSRFYKKLDQSETEQICKDTSEKMEKIFFEKAFEIGPGFGPSCTTNISNVIGRSPAFPNVEPGAFFPWNLFNQAR
jgi:hypothetical protein